MKIDSHQHFWCYDEAQYPWIPKQTPLHRDWLPTHLEPLLAAAGLDGCVAVQARQTLEETRWLLTLADHAPVIKGVVGWVDLQSDAVDDQLKEFAGHPRFVGVRHVLQSESDDRFMLRPAFVKGIGALGARGLAYDLLVHPRQLPAAVELAARFPNQRFILDHIAKPPVKSGTLSPWREQIRELARHQNVACKISGLVTEADLAHWKESDFDPYVEVVIEAFGGERVMYGSDWPVCLLAGTYARVFSLAETISKRLPEQSRAGYWGGNAARWYALKP